MSAEFPEGGCDPLDDPAYLRDQSRRLRMIIRTLADPAIKQQLAAHSFFLAQRAEAITRLAEDPAVICTNVERYRWVPGSDIAEGERRTGQGFPQRAGQALDGQRTLRELAAWYRAFAERAGNPAIWEARLRMAEDLDAEADRLSRRPHKNTKLKEAAPAGASRIRQKANVATGRD
jgi:hypothetical protein